jgi:uncharacterized protein (TIGR03435 family)
MLKSRLLGAVGIVAVVGGVLAAQTPEGPKFEVASVRIAPGGMGNVSPYGQNRWSTGCVPFGALLGIAFNVDLTPALVGGESRIVGLPSWSKIDCYAVAAKAEDGVILTREELRPRLKQLLEERFHLVAHIETRADSGYALVVAKGGAKLHETTNPLTRTALGSRTAMDSIRAPSVSMDLFAVALGAIIGQPVIDETGLMANYDLTLTFAPVGATDSARPSIFTALEEQLGLKLESGRKLPVDILVVDHVEHLIEN